MTIQNISALVLGAAGVLGKPPAALTLPDAFIAANVLDLCAGRDPGLPQLIQKKLEGGLRMFLFKNLGTYEALMLAERSWIAADLLESIASETEKLFEQQYDRI